MIKEYKSLEPIIEKFREYYNIYGWWDNTLYDGIEEMLDSLKRAGKKVVLATSKPLDTAKKVLEPYLVEQITDKDGNVIRNKYGRVQLLGDPSFEKRLIEEFPMMLAQAKKDYEELCPTDGNYILPPSVEESLEMLSEDNADIVVGARPIKNIKTFSSFKKFLQKTDTVMLPRMIL